MTDDRPAADFLPLTHSVFHILLSLAQAPRHGYGVIVDVRERTDGQVRLGTGTLYTAIQRLMEQALVEEAEAGEADASGRRTSTYEITALGREVVAAETARLRELVGLADDVLASGTGEASR